VRMHASFVQQERQNRSDKLTAAAIFPAFWRSDHE
jgi:hypothetical protein